MTTDAAALSSPPSPSRQSPSGAGPSRPGPQLSAYRLVAAALLVGIGTIAWLVPPPAGVDARAWHLFAIFLVTILAVMLQVLDVLPAAILALVVVLFTGTLKPADVYAGFGSGFILLIIVAFLIGRGVVSSGLGKRIALGMVTLFGRSTLGLGYAMVLSDAIIASAFPSNTARSGVLYPIALSLATTSGSRPEPETRFRLGAYLMMTSMAGLSISSALWFTAMAANPTGAALAKPFGLEITFLSWLTASIVPAFAALVLIPLLIHIVFPPQVRSTPEAPEMAREELRRMGPVSRAEWITGATFLGMVVGWAFAGPLGLDNTAIAFLGLAVLIVAGIFTNEDMKASGDALETFIWFAVLYTLSSQLNALGFMAWAGQHLAAGIQGLDWRVAYVALVTLYVAIHYLFVSQTAHLLALFAVFMQVGVAAGVPPVLLGMMLLFATNFFSVLTPQGSSANVVFAGSGYLRPVEIYVVGLIVTLANLAIFLGIGTPWILLVVAR